MSSVAVVIGLLRLTLKMPEIKIVEFANNIEPGEMAHHEPPYLHLHCLMSRFIGIYTVCYLFFEFLKLFAA